MLQSVGWALVHFVWQGTAIAVVLAISLAAARRAPATFRYALSAGAMLLLLIVPIGTVVRLRHSEPRFDLARTPADVPAVRDAAAPSDPVAAIGDAPVNRPPARVLPRASDTPSGAVQRRDVAAAPSSLRAGLESWLPWLVAVWILGVFVLSVRLLGGFLRARQLTTAGTKAVPDEWRRALARIAGALGVTQTVRIVESALIAMPVVIGWVRPVILLPASAFTGLTPQQLEAILAHELAHVRRHDYLVNLIQAAIETVLFYHPAVWWVSRRLRDEREHCCDDLAVAICGDARGYATALVDMERLRGAALAFALGAGGASGGGSLVTRVRRLLAPSTSRAETAPRWAAGAIAVVAALAIGGVSGVPTAVAQKAKPDQAKPAVEQQRAQAPDTVLKAPDSAAPLAARWAWADRAAQSVGRTGYWIGWTIKAPAALERNVYIDRQATIYGDGISMSGRMFGEFRGLRFPGQPIAPLIGGGDPGSIKLLLEFRGTGALARVHVSSFELPMDFGGHALLWLGAGEDEGSLGVLEPLYRTAGLTGELKEQLIDAIGVHGTSSLVVPALRQRLAVTEPTRVRAQAAEWLGWHPVPPALVLLAQLARTDRAGDVRREAAEAVGDMKLPAATDTLIALSRTLTDADARREAVEGLGQKDEPRARAALAAIAREDRQTDVQREAVETLGELDGPQGVAALKDIVRSHPNADVRREAVETLGQTLAAADAIPLLKDIAATDRNEDVAREAIETLGQIGTDAAHAAVLDAARSHPSADVRREAVETLGENWATDETVDQLSRMARDDRNPDVAREAVETLGEMGDGMGLGVVIELAMTHPHPDVRREAIETVGEHATPAEALKVLRDVIRNDRDGDVRREAVETLGQLHADAALDVLRDLAKNSTDPEVQREAVETLGESDRSSGTVDLLEAVARGARDEDARHEAVETLGEMEDEGALAAVTRIAKTHPDPDTRSKAVEILGQHGRTQDVVPMLVTVLNEDPSQDVQCQALETLMELPGGAGVQSVIQAARSHKNREVRQDALRKLAESDDPRVRALFDRVLGNP